MGDAAYAKLSVHWKTDEYKELCETNTENRKVDSGASMHTSGAKPHVSIWEEMVIFFIIKSYNLLNYIYFFIYYFNAIYRKKTMTK